MSQNNAETAPGAQEKINTNIVTLTRFLTEEQSKHKEATGDFTYVFDPLPVNIRSRTVLIPVSKTAMPCSTILLQVNCLLHPPSQSHKSQRSCRLIQQHR